MQRDGRQRRQRIAPSLSRTAGVPPASLAGPTHLALLAALLTAALACKSESREQAPPAATAQPTPATPATWYDETRPLYSNIPVTVRFSPNDREAAAAAWSYLESIDDTFNSYRADSEVGRLNVRGKDAGVATVSKEMADALRFSVKLHQQTDGAFDITVAPLMRLWSVAVDKGKPPSADEVAETRADVGLSAITVSGDSLTVAPGKRRALDFGGVIKGIAADRAAAMLRAAGATSVFVQVGNETVAFGPSPRDRPTTLAIEDPLGGDPIALIEDPGTGLSATTSSNSKQPRTIAGVTYYHIIDPRTGEPVSTRTLSATVVFAEPGRAGLADGLATAITVLGPARGFEIVREAGGEALVLSESGSGPVKREETDGFDRLIRRSEP